MFRTWILTSPIIQWSFASQRGGQARFDELYVATIPEIWKNVGVCCRFYVARIVCAWSWDAPCSSSWVWKPIPAGWPVCCSGVTKNNDQLRNAFKKILNLRGCREYIFAKFVDFNYRCVGSGPWNVTLHHDVLWLYNTKKKAVWVDNFGQIELHTDT